MTNSNEVIVLPTRNMSEADRDYAVAFAIPVDTPGSEDDLQPVRRARGTATSITPSPHSTKMTETLTVFDDVFVPRERVFLQKEWQYAGALAKTFVEFHRFTAISYKLPLTDTLAGAAQLIADYNGLLRAGHIREKITRLIAYTQTLRALTTQAALACRVAEEGIAVPSPLLVNIAKLHFAENYHAMIGALQDISGGILVTAPGEDDLLNPETRPLIEKYLGGREGVSAADRPAGAQHDFGIDGGGFRRLSGGAGDPRRGVHRGGKDDHSPRIRFSGQSQARQIRGRSRYLRRAARRVLASPRPSS